MRFPINLGFPLPDPPRDVRMFAAELAMYLEWSYKVAREIIGHGHNRAESRYNERVVKHAYQPGCLVRVLQHARTHNAPSKLDTQYSGLCEILEVRGALLTLCDLDTRRVFTANHDAVCRSTMSRAAAPQVSAARTAFLPPVLRAAHPVPPLAPPQAQARLQPAQLAVPPPPPVSAPMPPTRPQPTFQTNQQAKQPATARRRARALPDSREASLLPSFGSLAVLPPQSLHKEQACRNARRSAHAFAPQTLVPIAHSTQAPQVLSLIDFRVTAPPLFVRVDTSVPLHVRAV